MARSVGFRSIGREDAKWLRSRRAEGYRMKRMKSEVRFSSGFFGRGFFRDGIVCVSLVKKKNLLLLLLFSLRIFALFRLESQYTGGVEKRDTLRRWSGKVIS